MTVKALTSEEKYYIAGKKKPLETCVMVWNVRFYLHGDPSSHLIDTPSHPANMRLRL